jgi:hypothetical protein
MKRATALKYVSKSNSVAKYIYRYHCLRKLKFKLAKIIIIIIIIIIIVSVGLSEFIFCSELYLTTGLTADAW